MVGFRSALAIALMVLPLAVGCSAIINPDPDRLGAGVDAGPPRIDTGVVPVDAGPPGDCVEGSVACDGDALVSCFGGREIVQDCQAASMFCEVDRCEPWICAPGDRACSDAGTSALVCSARGDEVVESACGDGFCDPTTNACVIGPPPIFCEGIRRITPGESVVTDLCELPDDNTFVPAPGCDARVRAQSGDETFVLLLDRLTTLTFELTDVDAVRAIDTILYLRRGCVDAESQVDCHDDVDCGDSTVPGDEFCRRGLDPRQSRITLTLPAGRYYIVVDAFERIEERTTFSCGRVRLSIHLE